MSSAHGNGAAVAMHQARREPLCTPCAEFVRRLHHEAFRTTVTPLPEESISLFVDVPRSLYWRLEGLAEKDGITVGQYLVKLGTQKVGEATGLTFAQEKQIRLLWMEGKSIAKIARSVKAAERTVQARIDRWRPRERKEDGN